MTDLILFNVTNGLIIGAFYVLMALGLSLILNLSGVINFAHGGSLALGGYIAYTLAPPTGFWAALLLSAIRGATGLSCSVPDYLTQPVSEKFFFITYYRLFMVVVVALAVSALFLFLR